MLSRLAGSDPRGVSQAMFAQCISLGRRAGTVQLGHTDDSPTRFYVGGRTGALIKEQVCRQTLRWMRSEAAKPGSYTWVKGPDRHEQLTTAEVAIP